MVLTAVILSGIGLATSGYLVWKHYGPKRGPLVCPLGQSCDVVLDSKFGRLLGVRNEIIGLGYYVATLVLLAMALGGQALPFAVFGSQDPFGLAFLFSIPAALSSIALTALQHFVLRNYCSYCLLVNMVNVFLLFVLAAAR